jgi:hypothetical protein
MGWRWLNPRRAQERAQGIVEFAAIFPLFIALVFVMIDGGILMGRYNQVNHSAREGGAQSIGLLGSVPATCSGTRQICVQWFDGPNDAGEVGSYVRVVVRYDYNPITPIDNGMFGMVGFPDHWDVDSCAIARLERPYQAPSANQRSGTPSC